MESRRKWRGVENFPPVKKAQWGQYSPPQPLLCARFLPSCLCNSTLNWVGEGDRCLACLWKLSRPSELSWLFVWTHARRKGALSRNDLVIVAVWFVAGRWSVGVKEPPPPWKHTAHIDTHTPVNQQANVQPVDGAVYTSRLFDKPPPNSRVYEFGARRRVCGSIRRNRWLLSLLLHTKLLQWSDHIESRCEWANNWFP